MRQSIADLVEMLETDTAMLAVQYPNFFGQIDDFRTWRKRCTRPGRCWYSWSNPMALALFKPPASWARISSSARASRWGFRWDYGGPYLGFFATREQHVRKIAGRIIGETVDQDGKRAYVMTLRPREQDIRREKATSNICTNQGLMALAAGVYLSLMGRHGLRQVAEFCYHKAHYAATQIDKLEGYKVETGKPFFNEFVVKCARPGRGDQRASAAKGHHRRL